MIATSIEQSKQLVRLGLDPKTADMCWVKDYTEQWVLITDTQINIRSRFEGMYEYSGFQWQEHIALIPAWSLSALLEVMPSFIDYKGQKLRLTIEKAGIWNVFYLGTEHRLNEIWFNGKYGEPVEPAYKMVCWLLTNNLITNN